MSTRVCTAWVGHTSLWIMLICIFSGFRWKKVDIQVSVKNPGDCFSVLLSVSFIFEWKRGPTWAEHLALIQRKMADFLHQMPAEIKKCWYAVCLPLSHFNFCVFLKLAKRWNNIFMGWWHLLLHCFFGFFCHHWQQLRAQTPDWRANQNVLQFCCDIYSKGSVSTFTFLNTQKMHHKIWCIQLICVGMAPCKYENATWVELEYTGYPGNH